MKRHKMYKQHIYKNKRIMTVNIFESLNDSYLLNSFYILFVSYFSFLEISLLNNTCYTLDSLMLWDTWMLPTVKLTDVPTTSYSYLYYFCGLRKFQICSVILATATQCISDHQDSFTLERHTLGSPSPMSSTLELWKLPFCRWAWVRHFRFHTDTRWGPVLLSVPGVLPFP